MAPDVIPGISRGKVICIKVLTLFAPKSIAASSKDLSNPANLALTFITTNGMENVIWANVILPNPNGIFNTENIDKSAMPSTISGITMGIYNNLSIISFPLKLYL